MSPSSGSLCHAPEDTKFFHSYCEVWASQGAPPQFAEAHTKARLSKNEAVPYASAFSNCHTLRLCLQCVTCYVFVSLCSRTSIEEGAEHRKLFIISFCTLNISKYIKRKESNDFNFKNGLNQTAFPSKKRAIPNADSPKPRQYSPFSSHIKLPVWKPSSVFSINTEYTQIHRDTRLPIPQSFVPRAKVTRPFPISGPPGTAGGESYTKAVPQGRSWLPVGLGVAADIPTGRKQAEYLQSTVPPQHQYTS